MTRTPQLRAVTATAPPPSDAGKVAPAALAPAAKAPEPPVEQPSEEVAVPRRRTFTAEFKREVLAEADACTEPGAVGALLRRHGLYSSHLTEWRRLRDEGALSGLAPKKRGRRASLKNPLTEENAKLQRENQRLLARAERAERLLDLQKKVAELFGETLPPPPPELMPPPEGRAPRTRPRRRRR